LARQSLSTPLGSASSLDSNDSVIPSKTSKSAYLDKGKGGARKVMLAWAQQAITK